LPMERPVREAEVSVFSHATEDEEKVKHAVKALLGLEPEFTEARLEGHYNDPIILLTAKLDRKEATDSLTRIYTRLSSLDKRALLDSLVNRVDEGGSLYIRLDKQRAYNGRAVLAENDPIRIKFRLQLPHRAEPVSYVREVLVGMEDGEN